MCVKKLKVSKQRARQAMQGKWETDKITIKRKIKEQIENNQ